MKDGTPPKPTKRAAVSLYGYGLSFNAVPDLFGTTAQLVLTRSAAMSISTAPSRCRAYVKAVVVAEVDRLRWRIWNGKAKDTKFTLERIREFMPTFRGEQGGQKKDPPSRLLWTALRRIDRYLTSRGAC